MDKKYSEVEHTADWSIAVQGHTLEDLFRNALMGLYALAGVEFEEKRESRKTLNLDAIDLESLLVQFLEEALFSLEVDNIGFSALEIAINGSNLKAEIEEYNILELKKEIKAVTFSGLKVLKTSDGFSVNIVFDV